MMIRIKEIEDLAIKEGLKFCPVIFEIVNRDIMLEACAYGLPVRARHWSFGRTYETTKIFGEMGFSKVYEIVFNNDPAYAFLMDTNPDIVNIMVAAHVFGHTHFFTNNVMFKNSDRSMVYRAAERAARVDNYIGQYGLEAVEKLMDMGFAIDNHIDWNKGIYRKKYELCAPKERRHIVKEQDEFADLRGKKTKKVKEFGKYGVRDKFPPQNEKDLLWFLINYAPLKEWERDVLSIIREESYYFYPIVMTKIMNEGAAVFFHAELMYKYNNMTEGEFIDFCKTHSSVINPGNPAQINPYFLGFKVFTDIRKRWDKLHAEGKSDITGIQKVIKVAEEEDDFSFLRNYLTRELATDLGLFNYGYKLKRSPDEKPEDLTEEHGLIELKDRELNKIIEHIVGPTLNYGAPAIVVSEADGDTLVLKHLDKKGPLDKRYAEKTIEYMYNLWGGPIELETYDDNNTNLVYSFDESGFTIVE